MDWVNQLQKVNNKFKFQLFGKTTQNLNNCYANIQKFDEDNSRLMSTHVFNLFLNSFGVYLTTQQIRIIKENYHEGDKIVYLDFIQNVRNDISAKRLATIDHAFNELSQNEQPILIESLVNRYNALAHPHVKSMLKQAQSVSQQFSSAILGRSADRTYLNMYQFKQYYLDVNACYPVQREQYFIDLVLGTLRLSDNRVSIQKLKRMEVLIYEKVRERSQIKKDQGLKAQTTFRFFDMEDKGKLDFSRFVKVLDKVGCGFTHKDLKALFEKHAGADLLVTYQDMCALFFQMGSGLKDNTNPVYEISKNTGYITTPGMTKKLG